MTASLFPYTTLFRSGQQPGTGDDHRGEGGEAVAVEGVRDDGVRVRGSHVEGDGEPECGGVPERADDAGCSLAPSARDEHGAEQRHARRDQQRVHRREREPVDVRPRDHLNWVRTSSAPWSLWKECCVIAAGQIESASRHARRGTVTPSSAGRRSSAESDTAGPTSRCSTAETRRSTYMAASTIARAPATDHPQPRWKTPARIRNSPANADDNGTASAITPAVSRTVASAGRPRAIPPSRPSSPVSARRSTIPASRNSVAEIKPWLTICSTEPSRPRSFTAKMPIVISPICASDEYAITPRRSGARNASSDP